MADTSERLKLYEALELRSELDARIKTIKDCLPEARRNQKGLFSFREDGDRRPSPEFDVVAVEDRDIVEESGLSYGECSERLDKARLAFRALNRRLRAASFEVSVEFRDE